MYIRILVITAALCAIAEPTASASDTVAAAIYAAVADSHRPADQIALDIRRKPAKVIAFAGVRPGDRVADFMPGNAYFTGILSKLVGPTGTVYAFTPEEQIKNCEPSEIAGSRAMEHDSAYLNVVQLTGPVNHFSAPRRLNAIWIAQDYHDLHDAFLSPANIKLVDRSFFHALKPGGVLLIIDHTAAQGSGLRDTESLHRIDPRSVRRELEAAGFVFEAKSDALENSDDDHSRSVFDPAIRGRTDQFVYKFRKPAKAL